jgi:hypothetical protein
MKKIIGDNGISITSNSLVMGNLANINGGKFLHFFKIK